MVKRAEHASWYTIEAIIHDWLDTQGDTIIDRFEFSRSIGQVLRDCERSGYLVVLRHDAACFHCGKTWPRAGKDPHVGLCKVCVDKHNENSQFEIDSPGDDMHPCNDCRAMFGKGDNECPDCGCHETDS